MLRDVGVCITTIANIATYPRNPIAQMGILNMVECFGKAGVQCLDSYAATAPPSISRMVNVVVPGVMAFSFCFLDAGLTMGLAVGLSVPVCAFALRRRIKQGLLSILSGRMERVIRARGFVGLAI